MHADFSFQTYKEKGYAFQEGKPSRLLTNRKYGKVMTSIIFNEDRGINWRNERGLGARFLGKSFSWYSRNRTRGSCGGEKKWVTLSSQTPRFYMCLLNNIITHRILLFAQINSKFGKTLTTLSLLLKLKILSPLTT
jgi:hypothetical protein